MGMPIAHPNRVAPDIEQRILDFSSWPGELLNRDTFYWGTLKGVLTAWSCAGADLDLIEGLAVDDPVPTLHFLPTQFRDDATQVVGLSETATVQDLVAALASHPGALVVRWTSRTSTRTIGRD